MINPPQTDSTDLSCSSHAPQIACPECGRNLAEHGSRHLRCEGCGAIWTRNKGILCFARDPEFYFGEQARSVMKQGIQWMQELGFTVGFQKYLDALTAGDADYMSCYVTGHERVGFLPLLPVINGGRALDLGAGWGAVTLMLAQQFQHVTSMDLTLERIFAIQCRLRESNSTHVSLIHGGDRPRLPFADQQFDLVVVNGVLEYAGCSTSEDPRQSQLQLLAEVSRVLRPGGSILIGIENRLALKYFFGEPEDHLGVKYISLLPRWLGKKLAVSKGLDFRIYTHTLSGYRKLLHSTGFLSPAFFVPQPDYRFIKQILPAHDAQWVAKGWKKAQFLTNHSRRLVRCVARSVHATRVAHYFAHNFIILAGRTSATESRIEALLATLNEHTKQRWGTQQLAVSATGVGLLSLVSETGERAIGRYPLSRETAQRLNCAYRLRDQIREMLKSQQSPATAQIPATILKGANRPDGCWVEGWLPGRSPNAAVPNGSVLARSAAFVVEVSKVSNPPITLGAEETRRIVYALMPADSSSLSRMEIPSIAAELIKLLEGRRWKLTPSHGDFWTDNLLEDGGQMTGVIDWEFALPQSLLGLDLVHFLTMMRLKRTLEAWSGYGHDQAEFFSCFSSEEKEAALDAFAACGIALDDLTWSILQAAVWLNELRELAAMRPVRSSASWREAIMPSMIRVLESLRGSAAAQRT